MNEDFMLNMELKIIQGSPPFCGNLCCTLGILGSDNRFDSFEVCVCVCV